MKNAAVRSRSALPRLLFTLALLFPGSLPGCGSPEDIDCSQVFTGAVCGADGLTYKNDCYAVQAGIAFFLEGACPFLPCSGAVCGNNGRTYPSDCFAELSGVTVYMTGACPLSPCSAGPVCGQDGKTYASDCFAELSGVTVYQNGACP